VESFLGVMVDGSAKVFKITARPSVVAAMFGVCSAIHSVNLSEHLTTPPASKSCNAFVKLHFVGLQLAAILIVDIQHIGHVDRLNVLESTVGAVLLGNVRC
jgi:hypothetical protein